MDERDKKVEEMCERFPELPPAWWAWLLVGEVGVGKTTTALNILKWHKDFFEEIIWVSPTHDVGDTKVKDQLKTLGIPVAFYREFDQHLFALMTDGRFWNRRKCLVWDDQSGKGRSLSGSSQLVDLLTQRRHFSICCIAVGHRFSTYFRTLRDVFDVFSLFSVPTVDAMDMVIREMDIREDPEKAEALIMSCLAKPRGFYTYQRRPKRHFFRIEQQVSTEKGDVELTTDGLGRPLNAKKREEARITDQAFQEAQLAILELKQEHDKEAQKPYGSLEIPQHRLQRSDEFWEEMGVIQRDAYGNPIRDVNPSNILTMKDRQGLADRIMNWGLLV